MKVRYTALIILFFSTLSFLSGGAWTYVHSKERARDTYRSLEKFAQVFKLVKQTYVHEPEDKELVDGAISGMLQELDPHSVYLRPEDFAEMQADTKGEFGGLGIEISKRDGALTVVSPIEDTPAFKAGIKAGDIIAQIEGKPTDQMSVFDAVKLMRGKPGEPINISIKRQGVDSLIEKKVVRAIIKIKSVTHEVKEGFGVIKVRQFVERTSNEIKSGLKSIQKQTNGKINGLVLDLRNNPGGLLKQAIEVSDMFVDEGLVVYTQGRDEEKISKHYANSRGTRKDFPIVVLINGGSASASEIVAGALQDHKRAHIIGTQSFGKGSVQHVVPLEDGSGIKLTVALYYTPNGRQIQGAGINPDERVLGPFDVVELTREADLPGHIEGVEEDKAREDLERRKQARELKGEIETVKKLTEKDPDADPQMDRAIAYLQDQMKLSQRQ